MTQPPSVSTSDRFLSTRVETIRGNVGPTTLSETREVLALILDIS